MGWLSPKKWLVSAALILGISCLLGWYQGKLERLTVTLAEQNRRNDELTAANAGLALDLENLAASQARASTLVAETAEKAARADSRNRELERQLSEALRHEQIFDLDAPLPWDAAHALCLRYLSASDGDESLPGNAATGFDAATGNPVAAWCGGWRGLTPRQVIEWAGRLLDHAGDERRDKAALREWAAGADDMGKGR